MPSGPCVPSVQVDDLDDSMQPAPQQAQPVPVSAMPEEVQLPKIRVVVRKRPLNSRVRGAPPSSLMVT